MSALAIHLPHIEIKFFFGFEKKKIRGGVTPNGRLAVVQEHEGPLR